MNTSQDTPNTVITLEMICQQKATELFHPSEAVRGANALMSNFSSGIAIFNGVMTGFKIIKRIRNLFRR